MRTAAARSPLLALAALALLVAGAASAAEAPEAPKPVLTVEAISVEPAKPAADTLCRLRVTIRNGGDEIASRLGFAVTLNGQDLGVYGNQIFMYPIEPGASREIDLYNFWTTETSRAMPADGKLRVEVTLKEATWTRVATETDDEGEIEVWTPVGPVEGLPHAASITIEMTTGG